MGLVSLKIDNFAIIENIMVSFEPGFTVLTGETGAGKSIIIDALNLALGEKASPAMIRTGADNAVIECEFTGISRNHPVYQFLKDNQFPIDSELIILKRQLSANGRSKAWINEIPCTIYQLKLTGDLLVDLHGQHDHQSLLREDNHIRFLDDFGGYRELLTNVQSIYSKLSHNIERYDLLIEKRRLNRERRELWEFQLDEINRIDPHEDEYDQLVREKALLENSEKIHQVADELTRILYEDEGNTIYRQLLTSIQKLSILNGIDAEFSDELKKLEETRFVIQDLSNHLSTYVENIQFDPLRLETVNQRLYNLQQLMKKYGETLTEVLRYKENIRHNINDDEGLDVEILKISKEIDAIKQEYRNAVLELSEQRKKQAKIFEKYINEALLRLGIPGSQFKVRIRQEPDADGLVELETGKVKGNDTGINNVIFEISTNPGEPLRPLASIVSGGEVSRIMLAMKSIMAGKDSIPVVIFDEIDTGISGRIAQVVGHELKSLANVHQVICITHLPQIASLGNSHYKVYKVSEDGRSYTNISRLSETERIEEIASLIGGSLVTDTTRRQALELLTAK